MQSDRVYAVALIVHPHAETRAAIVRSLRDAGFQAFGVGGFEAAKHMLGVEPINVLVTEARLGDFHGLHLVLLARTANPVIFAAVITATPDAVLERDVADAGATLFVGDTTDSVVASICRRMTLPGTPGSFVQ